VCAHLGPLPGRLLRSALASTELRDGELAC
jgi:hypothetical protein